MYNLIQIQDAIKTVPLKDVMDYANGKSPQVPSYLALAELNRRKQLQETESAFYGEPGTLKEQIESSLTQAPQGMDITQTPPGQIDMTKLPPQLAPNLPPVGQAQPGAAPQGQVNPTAAPPVMAARGGMMRSPDIARGIASIPVSQFKQSNFAGGGIVAFADNEGETVGQAASRERGEGESYLDYFKRRASESLQGPFFSERGTMQYPKMYQSMSERTARETAAADAERKNQNLPQASYSNEGRAYRSDAPGPRVTPSPLVIPQDQNKQASATTSGQIEKPPAAPTAPPRPTIADRLGSAVPTEEETQAAIDRQRKLMEAYGISQDPYADVRKRYEAIEKRREERRAEEPSDRLMATLAAFSKAAPEKGLGYQLGVASEARAALSKEQNILRDKQDTEMAALYNSMAKEEDARKRGDMKAVELELKNQREHRAKIVDLEQKQEQVDAQMLNARANMVQAQRGPQAPAEIQLVEKIARDKGISFTEAYEYLQSAKGMEGLKRQADKEWNESMALRMEWEKKGGYPAYMASKGIAVGGGAAPAPGSRPAPKKGDVVQGYRFKGGDPSKQENWEKV